MMASTHEKQQRPLAPAPEVLNEEKFKCETFLPCDPQRSLHRYIILFGFICMLMFGWYYSYYNANALESTIIKVMNLSSTKYEELYLVYTWPNVIVPACGGYLLDRYFGIRIGTCIFCALIFIGQSLFALGGFLNKFWIMVVGRFVFGLGGENLAAATYSYMVLWFKINELNMAFGFFLSFGRIASTFNQNFSQKIFNAFQGISSDHVRLGAVLMIGVGICFISLLCAIFLGQFDRRAEKILKKNSDTESVEMDLEKISIKHILKFPLKLWLLIVICVIYYVTVDPFLGLAVKFFVNKYRLSFSTANFLSSFVYLISAVFSPIFGIFIGKKGLNLIWLNFGIILTFCAHFILVLYPYGSFMAYLAMSLMGIAYTICANIVWSLIAHLVPEYQLGTAFGIMLAVQNVGLAVFIIVADDIEENFGYIYLEITFMILLYVAFLAGIILYLYDVNFGGQLNMSGQRRARLYKIGEVGNGSIARDLEQQGVLQLGRRAPYNYENSPLVASSNFHIRNRLLSRMGTKIPEHLSSDFERSVV